MPFLKQNKKLIKYPLIFKNSKTAIRSKNNQGVFKNKSPPKKVDILIPKTFQQTKKIPQYNTKQKLSKTIRSNGIFFF